MLEIATLIVDRLKLLALRPTEAHVRARQFSYRGERLEWRRRLAQTLRSVSAYSGQTEYHLTPRGWVRGTESYFDRLERIVAAPPDRVETWVRRISRVPDCLDSAVDWEQTWRSKGISGEERQALLRRFPHPRLLDRGR